MTKKEQDLLKYLNSKEFDAIVVEGYEGVGKGHVLTLLSEHYGVTPYRPDYNLWQAHDLKQPDRWKISGFFWDVYSHFTLHTHVPLLFDRGVISGAVYNHDKSIADDYSKLLRGHKVLHILVTCDKETYLKLQDCRGAESQDDTQWEKYLVYTREYMDCLDRSGVEYITYQNIIDETAADELKLTCFGCGHYNYGWCRHPAMNCRVTGTDRRCQYSSEKEVQDAAEVYCV